MQGMSANLIRELQALVGVTVDGAYGPATHAAVMKALAIPVAPADRFSLCLAEVLKHEGGWADHPKDPGGATMKGVTLATYRQYKPGASKQDLRNITDDELKRIYRDGFWDKVRGDELPAGVDLVVFDIAVNSGPGRAAEWLQEAVGVRADRIVGPATIAAVKASQPLSVIDTLDKRRDRFYRSLSNWTTFGKGWTARRLAVTAKAKEMAR